MQLRPYQREAVDFAAEKLKAPARVLLQLPTGSGKTLVAIEIIKQWLASHKRAIVIAPSASAVTQTGIACIKAGLRPVADMGQSTARQTDRLIITTYHSAWRRLTDTTWNDSLLIIDECHHLNDRAIVNSAMLEMFHHAVGLSASPWSVNCRQFFDSKHTYPLSRAIKDGVVCSYELVEDEPIASNKYQIVYGYSNTQVKDLARLIRHSDWALYDRADSSDVISRFKMGLLGTLVVNRKATEGFDCPAVKDIWILRQTRSPILAYQMIGRALRPFEGKRARIRVREPETRASIRQALQLAE